MPTGYTADITDKNLTFKEFALSCAHAFLNEMREESHDAEIADRCEPYPHYKEEIVKSEIALKQYREMSIEEAEKLSELEFKKEIAADKKYAAKKKSQKEKYESMLKQVRAWKPPTKDHVGIKKFMIQQIETSIEYDCYERAEVKKHQLTGKQWLNKKIEEETKHLLYYTKEHQEEIKRTNQRNKWVRNLKNSLDYPSQNHRFDNIV